MIEYKKNIDKKKAELKEQMDSMKSDEARAIMFAIGKQDEEPLTVSTVKPETDTRKITLSNLLNIMDGISNMPGRIIIFSTNHSEKLDEAFLRPGRIDLRINFGRPTKPVIYQIILHWYKCIDEFYPEKNRTTHFKKIWKNTYEKRILDKKYRPCDITNLLQKYGDNIEGVLDELV
jgi:SpoVK/Ycf46/Vps4 family AAA+-type ATPase